MKKVLVGFWVCIVVVLLFSQSGCRTIDRIFVGKPMGDLTEKQLVKLIHQNEFDFETLYFRRLSMEFDVEGQQRAVRANMYIKKDSAIIISVIPFMGVEAARILLTPTSVEVVDRMNREVMLGDYDMIKRRFNVDMDFYLLQNVLANRVFQYPHDDFDLLTNYYGSLGEGNYIISSFREGELFTQTKNTGFQQIIYILPDLYRVSKMNIFNVHQAMDVTVNYKDFRNFDDGFIFPGEIRLTGQKSNKKSYINFFISNVEVNSSHSLSFTIPNGYERVYL